MVEKDIAARIVGEDEAKSLILREKFDGSVVYRTRHRAPLAPRAPLQARLLLAKDRPGAWLSEKSLDCKSPTCKIGVLYYLAR